MADRVFSPRWAMLFFGVLPFTDKRRRGIVRCVKTLKQRQIVAFLLFSIAAQLGQQLQRQTFVMTRQSPYSVHDQMKCLQQWHSVVIELTLH